MKIKKVQMWDTHQCFKCGSSKYYCDCYGIG